MTTTDTGFHLRAGTAARGPYAVDVDPDRAGWGHSSLRVLELPPGGEHTFDAGDSEWIVLPLAGGCAVHTGGTAVCWGSGAAPVNQAVGATTVSAVRLGTESACVLTTGATVKCVGANAEGELGDGTAGDSTFMVTARIRP